MRFYKVINGEYITEIGTGLNGEEITESEYNEILTLIQNKPPRTETTDYRLKTDLIWEPYEVEPEPDIPSAEELLEIILGGAE